MGLFSTLHGLVARESNLDYPEFHAMDEPLVSLTRRAPCATSCPSMTASSLFPDTHRTMA